MNIMRSGSEVYMEHVLQCDDSIESIFTGIYEAYARKYDLNSTRILIGEEIELRLFAEYEKIETDEDKFAKVARTVRRLAGEEVFRQIYLALASVDREKGNAVFKTIQQIVKCPGKAAHVMERLSDVNIHKTFTLFRNVQNETHSIKEFLRFSELYSGILYARIAPKNNIISFIMPHFADRFPMENFLIYDEGRNLLGVHQSRTEWYMVHGVNVAGNLITISENEEKYRELFKYFCHKIAIKERENPDLQRNNLPLKYREYMVEFT